MADIFKFDRYDPWSLQRRSNKELRAEYSRLRDICQKRLKRLGQSEFNTSQVYLYNKDRFKGLRDIPLTARGNSELRHLLSDMERFLSAETSTVSGAKAHRSKTLNTLHSHGYGFVTEANIKQFGDFMEALREQNLDMIYDSERVAALYSIAETKGIDPDVIKKDFDYWLNHSEELWHIQPDQPEKWSATQYRNAINFITGEKGKIRRTGYTYTGEISNPDFY